MNFLKPGVMAVALMGGSAAALAASAPLGGPAVRLDGLVIHRLGSDFRVSEVIDWERPLAARTWVPEFPAATDLKVLGRRAGQVIGKGVLAAPGQSALRVTFTLPVDGAGIAASRAWPFRVDQAAVLIGSGVDFPVILNQRFYGRGGEGGYQVYVTERPIPANTNLIVNLERAVGGEAPPLARRVNPNTVMIVGYLLPLLGFAGWLFRRRMAAGRRRSGNPFLRRALPGPDPRK